MKFGRHGISTRNHFTRRFAIEQLERRDLFAGLLDQSDLQYLGAFRVPNGTFGASTFEYGGTALAFNPANNSLFIVGHDWDQAVAEISIPTIRTGSLGSLSTASVLQPFVDVMARVPNDTLEGNVKVGGLMVVGNQLIGTAYEFYDAEGDAVDSHFKLSSLNLSSATVTGLFQVGNLGGGYVGGYMATVASEWQDDFGVSYLTGQAGLSIISRTSAGPAAFGFNPAQLGSSTAPATSLVYYPLSDPLRPEASTNPVYNTTSEIKGMVFPEGTDSVLFFGSHGIGQWYYGEASDPPGDPYRTSKGQHAAPYVYQAWAYNANDLLAVKNGTKEPWEVEPYGVWQLNVPYATGSKWAGGVAYDAATGRIFVSELHQDSAKPVIHVYQVGAAAPDTAPPVISSTAAGSVTPSGATVTWTTNEASDTQVEYGTTTAYGSQTTLNSSMVTSHSAQLSGLTAGTLYHYRVKSRDAAGNLRVSPDGTFTTAAADTTAPVIASIAANNVTSSGATIIWNTNEGSDTQVEYGLTTSYGSQTTLNTSMVTSHSVQLSGMAPGTTCHYRVKSRDAAGNLSVSADGSFTTTAAAQGGYSYDNPPPLPPSNPATTVNVSNVSQLISAVNNLQSGRTISLAAGTYNLSGVTDALYVPQGISNWSIRGATGDRDDVVIRGAGMSGSVRFGFWIGASPTGMIADLTIDGVREHGVIANYGAHDLLVHNVRIVDSGSPFVKSNPNGADGNDRGIVEYSVFEYRTTDTDNYTNGVDVHAGDGWNVRYNLFKNFLSPAGQGIAGPAVLAWNGSSNTTVEGNTFINVARGVSLGLVDKAGGNDHQGGLIANNMFYRDPSLLQAVDVPIFVADSPNTKVFHNTVLNRGSYPNAIEYRFASASGLQIRNNLTDSGIQARDGATAAVTGNTTNASTSWFVNPTAGDLHLLSTAPVINQASVLADVPLDFDGQSRGSNPDVGADEFSGQAPGDTTPPVISSIAAGSISASGATVTWTTNEASNTQVEYGPTTSYGSQTTLNTSMVTSHSAQLSGLTASTTYHYRVKSRDAAGNLSVSTDRTFTTAAAPDTTPPVISSIAAGSITASGATVTWTTNEASDTQVEYGLTASYGSQTTLNTSLVTSHSAQLSGLTAGTLYHYRVKSRDAAGNQSVSTDGTFTTAAAPDTTPPVVTNRAPINGATIASSTTNIDITFSEPVNGVDATDLVLTGSGAADAVKGAPINISGNTWRFGVSKLENGPVNVSLAPDANDIEDAAGNDLAPVTWTFNISLAAAPVLAPIGNKTMPSSQDLLQLNLAASDANNDPLTFGAVAQSIEYHLGQTLGLGFSGGDEYLNWAGRNEKWLTGTGGAWYYITPDGKFYRYLGGDPANDQLVDQVSTAAYSNTALLYNAQANNAPASVTVSGSTLTINPNNSFRGKFYVTVTVSDGSLTDSELFSVTVQSNSTDTTPPSVTNRTPTSGATITATATNIDITFSEPVFGIEVTDLVLTGSGAADAVKGAPVNISGNTWRFGVSKLENGPVNVALAPDSNDIQDAAGNDLAPINWTFDVSLAAPPVLASIGNRTMPGAQDVLQINLSASDANNDPLTFSATAQSVEYHLDQTLGLGFSGGNEYLNWAGRNEKWLTGAGGTWYYITPDGKLYRWLGGDYANDPLVEQVSTAAYANTALLHNAQANNAPASVSVSGNTLTINPNNSFRGKFYVTVTVSDGALTDSELFTVTVQ